MENRLEDKIEKLKELNHKHDIFIERLTISIEGIEKALVQFNKELERNTENWMEHMARTSANEEKVEILEEMLVELKTFLGKLENDRSKLVDSMEKERARVDRIYSVFKGATWAFGIMTGTALLLSRLNLINVTLG